MNEKFDFVFLLFDHSVSPGPMTAAEAQADLDRFVREGWEIPEGLTGEEYAEIWNALLEDCQEDRFFVAVETETGYRVGEVSAVDVLAQDDLLFFDSPDQCIRHYALEGIAVEPIPEAEK